MGQGISQGGLPSQRGELQMESDDDDNNVELYYEAEGSDDDSDWDDDEESQFPWRVATGGPRSNANANARWPFRSHPKPNSALKKETLSHIEAGELKLLEHWSTSGSAGTLQGASAEFEAARQLMTRRDGKLASHMRVIAEVGLAIESCLNQVTSEMVRIASRIMSEPSVSWYFYMRPFKLELFISLYSCVHARLLPQSIESKLIQACFLAPVGKQNLTFESLLCKEAAKLNHLIHTGSFGKRKLEYTNVYSLMKSRYIRGSKVNQAQTIIPGQAFVPNKLRGAIRPQAHSSRCYNGQFNKDGSLFYGAWQDWTIRLYDTTQIKSNKFVMKKAIRAQQGQWVITDCRLSNSGRFLLYSSITPFLYICPLDDSSKQRHFDVSSPGRMNYFGIWSIRMSNDDREVICGTNAHTIDVVDLEHSKSIFSCRAHDDEVNAVCFLQDSSSQVFASGSDDGYIKIWDRRTISKDKPSPSGVLSGHIDGITFISAKGDGTYILSNSKDQTMKLWDIRKMGTKPQPFSRPFDWDYRFQFYPGDPYKHFHPQDQSVATCIGHRVTRTLIRCYFSPEFTTSQRLLYSGGQDGVYIYNTGGSLVKTLPVPDIVRDVSWHPTDPTLVATSWDGTISVFSYDSEDDIF